MKEMLDAAAFAVSSPTLNNGLFSTICDFLVNLKPASPEENSYDIRILWLVRGAVKIIEQELKNCSSRSA